MEVEVVRDGARLAELAPEWDRLEQAVAEADSEPGGTYYLTHRFVSAWWWSHQSEPGYELAVLVVRHNGDVVGIAPLATVAAQRAGQPVTRLRFASHGDYLGFLIDRAAPQGTVAKNLLTALENDLAWQSARLGGILVHSPLGQHLLRSDEYNAKFTLHVENPYIDLSQCADFAQFQERLPKHTRKWRNKLLRDHPDLTFRVVSGDAEDIFERIGRVHRAERDHLIATQGRTERHSLFDDRARWGHYHRVFTTTDDTRTFVLEAPDGSLAGYRTTFRDGRRLLSWNGAYHPDFADYRIGSVLLHDMVEHLLDTGEADVLDLGAGRYAWKFSWTPDFRATYHLHLERDLPDEAAAASADPAATVSDAAETTAPDTAPDTGVGTASGEAASTQLGEAAPPQPRAGAAETVKRGRLDRLRSLLPGGAAEVSVPSTTRTTYVISPHPDDETLRTTGFLTHRVPDPDERFVLVAISDGGNSSLSRRRGWSPEQERAARRAEQTAAWAALTGGRGQIIRLGLPDGALTTEGVATALREAVPGILESGARVVVAAHAQDYHADHRAVVRAVRELTTGELSASLAPLMADPKDRAHLHGDLSPAPVLVSAARVAHDAYREFGQRSVPPEFAAHATAGFRSRLTDPAEPLPQLLGAHGAPLPRVLVLASTREALREVAADEVVTDADLDQAWHPTWAAGTLPGAGADAQDLLVEPLPVTAGQDWASALSSGKRARLLLAETDLILSLDEATDAALAGVETDARVVPAADAGAVLTAGRVAAALVTELTDPEIAQELDTEQQFAARLNQWTQQAQQAAAGLPPAPELTRTWADVWLGVATVHEPSRTARIRVAVLSALPWEDAGPGSALRAALALEADLTTDEGRGRASGVGGPAAGAATAGPDPSRVAREVLTAADEAMSARRNQDALDHLSAAVRVLFHPALHADWDDSPLVHDAAGYLQPLWASRSFRTLLDREKGLSPWGERLLHAETSPGDSSGGQETRDELVIAPDDDQDPPVLRDLAGLIGSQHRRPRFGQSQPPQDQRSRGWALSAQLLEASHVRADGVDRAAVWVSHLCPPATRLVLHVPTADATGPWLPLVRWDRVDAVTVESEAVATLVRAVLAGRGVDVPVQVGPSDR